jgi:hypothetical protein
MRDQSTGYDETREEDRELEYQLRLSEERVDILEEKIKNLIAELNKVNQDLVTAIEHQCTCQSYNTGYFG